MYCCSQDSPRSSGLSCCGKCYSKSVLKVLCFQNVTWFCFVIPNNVFSDSSVKDLIRREQLLWNPVWQITTFIHSQLPQSLLMPQRTSVGLVFLAPRRAILWLVRARGQFLLNLVSHILYISSFFHCCFTH